MTLAPDGRTLYVPFAKDRASPIRKDGKIGIHYEVDGEITVWDVASGRQLPSLKQSPPHAVLVVTMSPDGAILLSHDLVDADSVASPPRVLTQWDLRTGRPRHLLDGGWHPVFAPDGKTFAASSTDNRTNSKLMLWDVAAGKERLVFAQTQKGLLFCSAFSPDGRYLAGLQNLRAIQEPPEVKLWDVATGKEIASISAPKETTASRRPGSTWAFTVPAFSPDGRWLATCLHTGRVYLYDVAGRKLAWTQEVKHGWLGYAEFSPDGRWLAVAGQDVPEDRARGEEISPLDHEQPRIFLFDLKRGGKPEEIVAPHGFICKPAFSPDGKTIALGGTGCVWLFDVSRPATHK